MGSPKNPNDKTTPATEKKAPVEKSRLKLKKETLRKLSDDELDQVVGGRLADCCAYGGTALNSASNFAI